MGKLIEGEGLEVETSEVEQPSTIIQPTDTVGNYHIDGARAMMEYFMESDFDQGIFADEESKKVFAHFAPFAFECDLDSVGVGYQLMGQSRPDVAQALLEDYCGAFVSETNLFSHPGILESPSDLMDLFPGFIGLAAQFEDEVDTMVTPFTQVLMLPRDYRGLAALVVSAKTDLYNQEFSKDSFFDYFQQIIKITVPEIVAMAKNYGEKDLVGLVHKLRETEEKIIEDYSGW